MTDPAITLLLALAEREIERAHWMDNSEIADLAMEIINQDGDCCHECGQRCGNHTMDCDSVLPYPKPAPTLKELNHG